MTGVTRSHEQLAFQNSNRITDSDPPFKESIRVTFSERCLSLSLLHHFLEGKDHGFYQLDLSYSDQIYGLDVTAEHSFLIPELMAMTFSHLKIHSNRCLLNLALTCKDFLDIALDALWEVLYSFMPLLKLLPTLQFENESYVCANVHAFIYVLILSLGPYWRYFSDRLG